MSSCTECHGMAGKNYDDHQSNDCPRLATSPKPTDSEQLRKRAAIFADDFGFTYDKIHLRKSGITFATNSPEFGEGVPSQAIPYSMLDRYFQILLERDQQRLSAALEAVDDELIPVSHYTECLRLLHEDDATIPDDCSCGAELRMKQALTAVLGPDNNKIEE